MVRKKRARPKTVILPFGNDLPQRESGRLRDRKISRQYPNPRPEKSQTENKVFCKRPLTASRPRPQTQVVLLLPNPALTICGQQLSRPLAVAIESTARWLTPGSEIGR